MLLATNARSVSPLPDDPPFWGKNACIIPQIRNRAQVGAAQTGAEGGAEIWFFREFCGMIFHCTYETPICGALAAFGCLAPLGCPAPQNGEYKLRSVGLSLPLRRIDYASHLTFVNTQPFLPCSISAASPQEE